MSGGLLPLIMSAVPASSPRRVRVSSNSIERKIGLGTPLGMRQQAELVDGLLAKWELGSNKTMKKLQERQNQLWERIAQSMDQPPEAITPTITPTVTPTVTPTNSNLEFVTPAPVVDQASSRGSVHMPSVAARRPPPAMDSPARFALARGTYAAAVEAVRPRFQQPVLILDARPAGRAKVLLKGARGKRKGKPPPARRAQVRGGRRKKAQVADPTASRRLSLFVNKKKKKAAKKDAKAAKAKPPWRAIASTEDSSRSLNTSQLEAKYEALRGRLDSLLDKEHVATEQVIGASQGDVP